MSKNRILHLEAYNYSENSLKLLSKYFEVDQIDIEDRSGLITLLKENSYYAIITRLGLSIDKYVIDLQEDLNFIVTPTTGLNHIDLEYANSINIQVISLKSEYEFLTNVKSTAEHTWALLLTLIRNIPKAIELTKEGTWERKGLLADELSGKTIGIIGYGRLGKIVKNYAQAFGMKVLLNDLHQPNLKEEDVKFVELNYLLSKSDFILLMINYEKENFKFLNSRTFKQFKKGAYFINTSRGELIDEEALIEALSTGRLKGAALDVLNGDSAWNGTLSELPKLIEYSREHDNLLITPHIGGYGIDSIQKTRQFITEKLIKNYLS